MSLESPDQLHLRAAHGYLELGMFEEANAELDEIGEIHIHAEFGEYIVENITIEGGTRYDQAAAKT
jgi:hypothetical protein